MDRTGHVEAGSGWRFAGCLVNGSGRPSAVDPDEVCFSWRLEADEPNQRQRRYRLAVREWQGQMQDGGEGSLIWDSGWVEDSDDRLRVEYAGPVLSGGLRYIAFYYSVNDAGEEAQTSLEFDTALRAGQWTASWIWKSSEVRTNDYAMFRKTFPVTGAPRRVMLYASAHHYMKLYINGRLLSGYGSPAPTTPQGRKYVLSYEVTADMKAGANTVSAVVHYLGGGSQNAADGLPGFLCQVMMDGENGPEVLAASDSNWECGLEEAIPYACGMPYQQSRRLSAVERYEGALGVQAALWLAGHQAADDMPAAARLSQAEYLSPAWPLQPQEIPEGRAWHTCHPKPCGIQNRGCQVFDAGRIVSGWVKLRLRGTAVATTVVRVRYAETLEDTGRVARFVCNEPSEYYYDEYIPAGLPEEVWQADFAYKAFRYFEITGYSGWLRTEDIEVVCAGTPLGDEGSFECSDPLVNAMFAAAMNTQRNNVLGQIVDCPHREQAQYLADTDLQAEVLTVCFEAGAALRKTLTDFADAMLEDGSFPFVAPGNFERPEFHIQIPEWDLHYVSLLWKVCFTYDDRSILKRCYPVAERLMSAVWERRDRVTGLLPQHENGWHISDWPYPTIDHGGLFLTVYQLKAYEALQTVARLADWAGKPDAAEFFLKAAETLRTSMRRHLYDGKKRRWRDSSESACCSQGTNALACRIGLVPPSRRSSLLHGLSREWTARTVLSLPLFRLLFEEGKAERAYQWLTRKEAPGWGYMIMQGSKTMWEGFDDIESHSHAWNGYPARLLLDYIAGITASEPGFRRVRISPYFPASLTYAAGTVKTVRGDIHVRWDRREDGILLFIHIPVSVEAVLEISEANTLNIAAGSHAFHVREGEVVAL